MNKNSILIIDDNEEFLNSSIEFLTLDMKMDIVVWAVSPEEAADKIKRYNPGIILLDLGTRKHEEMEFSVWLKSLPSNPKVIITSDLDNQDYRNFALQNEADGFLTKDHFKDSLPILLKYLNFNKKDLFMEMPFLLN